MSDEHDQADDGADDETVTLIVATAQLCAYAEMAELDCLTRAGLLKVQDWLLETGVRATFRGRPGSQRLHASMCTLVRDALQEHGA
jgi:hypothetical protein